MSNLKKELLLVSCIIPTYKRSDMLNRAIDSILNQTYSNIEVIVVDDNEPNDEYSIEVQRVLESYSNNKKVRYIQQKKHKNGAVARNVGIKNARGKYIAFLDDDDEWFPQKVEKQMNIFKQDNSINAVTCLWKCYKNGEEYRKCHQYTADNLQFKVFLREVAIFTSTIIIKKDIINKYGGFDEKLLRHQDLQFLIEALEYNHFYVLNDYLVKLHTDSEINKPNVEKMITTKKEFFKSVDKIMSKYSRKEKRRIKNAHYYEIVFCALKSRKIGTAIKYMFKSGFYPSSIKDLYIRYIGRKK